MGLSKGFSSAVAAPSAVNAEVARQPVLLVVDDEREITTSLADQFRRDYQVVTAASAEEALTLLQSHDISVIVADQRMPGKTGSELLAEVCLIDADVVRIILTGYADIDAVIQAVNQGQIFFYLTKPWRGQELEAVIGKAMEHNRLLRDNRRLVEDLRRINNELEARVKERTLQLEERARDLEAANRTISDLAYLDALTGVANRRSLDETLVREAERVTRLGLPLTVVLLDVDHFKSVNDTFGHAVGDKVLQVMAATVASQARPYDLVARYGGEEFLVMMPGATLKNGGVAAERFRAAIAALDIEGISRKLTASFGVASLTPGDQSATLFERADQALYRAKKYGRNRVELDQTNEGDQE